MEARKVELYNTICKQVARTMANKMGLDKDWVEDLQHEAFVSLERFLQLHPDLINDDEAIGRAIMRQVKNVTPKLINGFSNDQKYAYKLGEPPPKNRSYDDISLSPDLSYEDAEMGDFLERCVNKELTKEQVEAFNMMRQGFTEQEVGKKIGVDQATISRWRSKIKWLWDFYQSKKK